MRIKDLPFTDFFKRVSKTTKKITSIVFPNDVEVGHSSKTTNLNVISGTLSVDTGSLSVPNGNITAGGIFIPAGNIHINSGSLEVASGSIYVLGNASYDSTIFLSNPTNRDESYITYNNTSNRMVFGINSSPEIRLTVTALSPETNGGQSLGTSDRQFLDINYSGDINGQVPVFVHFAYTSTGGDERWVPWFDTTDQDGVNVGLVPPETYDNVSLVTMYDGEVRAIKLYSNNNIGATEIDVYINGSLAEAGDTTITAGDTDVVTYTTCQFTAHDQISVLIDPTNAGDQFWGVMEMVYNMTSSRGV